jgi:plasmid stabilization system protein ParE
VRAIRWTTEAADEFVASIERIQQDSPAAALKLAQAVTDSIERLTVFPGIGRLSEVGGTRELVCPPYVVVYNHTDEVVELLHIWHGAQDWK